MMERYTQRPFPAYTHVPGKTPHPVREPSGHSFGIPEPEVPHFDGATWKNCEAYLFGIDLFNAGFYWEAHEQWEAAWHSVGRQGKIADFLKGLIKLAAAGVKQAEVRHQGVLRHAARAGELFASVQQAHAGTSDPEKLCGLDLQMLKNGADRIAQEGWNREIRLTLG